MWICYVLRILVHCFCRLIKASGFCKFIFNFLSLVCLICVLKPYALSGFVLEAIEQASILVWHEQQAHSATDRSLDRYCFLYIILCSSPFINCFFFFIKSNITMFLLEYSIQKYVCFEDADKNAEQIRDM